MAYFHKANINNLSEIYTFEFFRQMIPILDNLPISWKQLISLKWPESQQAQWQKKIQICLNEKTTTPPINTIFKAFELCEPQNVKVIIIGQDPYPTFGHANGLAFSTEDFVQPFPRSLLNIFKELKRSMPGYEFPLTGNLTSWAEQGVFLINTCLTTEIGLANAHKDKGWEEFTDLILSSLNDVNKNLVILFWGKQAMIKMDLFSNQKHLLLHSSHPSPLSVRRGFEGCNHFVDCNAFLKTKKIPEINWQT
jgi:uracil-DNA glycosylase